VRERALGQAGVVRDLLLGLVRQSPQLSHPRATRHDRAATAHD
jgi:hypothetical protein